MTNAASESEGQVADGSSRVSSRFRRYLLLVAPLVVLVVYTCTFLDRPVVLKRIDVLADADASLYAVLLPQYRPDQVFGNATESRGRGLNDIMEAIKVKHALYAVVGHSLWSGSSVVASQR